MKILGVKDREAEAGVGKGRHGYDKNALRFTLCARSGDGEINLGGRWKMHEIVLNGYIFPYTECNAAEKMKEYEIFL